VKKLVSSVPASYVKKLVNFYVPEFQEGIGYQEKDIKEWQTAAEHVKGKIFST